jgi:hypothetical protein
MQRLMPHTRSTKRLTIWVSEGLLGCQLGAVTLQRMAQAHKHAMYAASTHLRVSYALKQNSDSDLQGSDGSSCCCSCTRGWRGLQMQWR